MNASGPAGTAVQMIARLADTDALYFLLSGLPTRRDITRQKHPASPANC